MTANQPQAMVETQLPGEQLHYIRRPSLVVPLLSCAVQVISDRPWVLRQLPKLYPSATSCLAEQSVEAVVVVGTTVPVSPADGAATAELSADVRSSRPAILGQLEDFIDTTAIAGCSRSALIHAGAVGSEGKGVILPAQSGAGKSTLVAALALSGFRYLSDELAVVDGSPPALHPYPKAICLKDGGWRVLGTLFQLPRRPLRARRPDGRCVRYLEAPLPYSFDDHVAVRYVVIPRRQAGADSHLDSINRAEALAELARNSVNLPRYGERGLELLAESVEGADCYALTYDSLRGAVEIIRELMGPNSTRSRPLASVGMRLDDPEHLA